MSASKYREALVKVPEVIAVDVVTEDGTDYLTVLADAEQVGLSTLKQVETKIATALSSVKVENTLEMLVRSVRLETPIETLKRQVDEYEGVLGVYVTPREWGADKRPTVIGFVINIDAQIFDSHEFEQDFRRLVILHGVRVRLQVDFVKYAPENKPGSIVLA